MDRELVDSAVSKGRAQEEVERRERQRKANQLHNMYREQEMAVEHRKEMEREQKEREEREMLSRMREETRRAEEEEEAKRRDARERAARQKEIVLEQVKSRRKKQCMMCPSAFFCEGAGRFCSSERARCSSPTVKTTRALVTFLSLRCAS